MLQRHGLVLGAACAVLVSGLSTVHAGLSKMTMAADPHVLDHEATRIDGTTEDLAETYAGRVVLIVNVASRCGYTKQYAGLQALHAEYADKGLSVLGFPCNDFGAQEPGSEAEIMEFCRGSFDVEFPMFSKVRVVGEQAHPLYLDLREQPEPIGGEPRWNFTKFLLNRSGEVIARFEPSDDPNGPKVRSAIEQALDEAPEEPAPEEG